MTSSHRLLPATIALISAISLGASPARPVRHTATLPDGSTVGYRLVGDERFHYLVTDDGYPLVADGATLCFAETGDNGRMVSSGVAAADPQFRSPATLTFLKNLDSNAVIEKAALSAEISPIRAISPKYAPSRAPESMSTTTFPVTGSPRGLIILAEYTDVKFSTPMPQQYFSDMLNLEGFDRDRASGSARDYFIVSSAGVFTPQFDVVGPVTLPHTQAYYGRNEPYDDANAAYMIPDACDILAAQGFDFSIYDCDNDGEIDNVYLIYAGRGESSGNLEDINTVWPHSWKVGDMNRYYNGCLLNHYACSNEIEGDKPDGIGTFCHEFSHVMGLPDLYYTGHSLLTYLTPDTWSVLDIGCYLNDSRTPPLYSSFERMSLGWLKPEVIDSPGEYALEPLADTNTAYLVKTDSDDEFFLFENRRKEGWDSYLRGEGMLIWHIDYDKDIWFSNTVNNTRSHQHVDLVEAISRTSPSASPSDPFPGASNVTEYTADTAPPSPRFISWSHNDPGYPLTNIRTDGRLIRFMAGNSDGSAIDGIMSPQSVTVRGDKAIIISGSDLPASVYTIAGTLAYHGESRRIILPTGLYIVKVGNHTTKVALH
ncbi:MULTISPECIES: M6 family metalloprotease domain-containing protein [Duncaniella]|uniref:M6 family metalloprotease domain-containing protein n=1 Tax=Duncaniella TaxID=2518495 RepID=UPI0023F4328A|nr:MULTISPECIES: M6 family metalloprotease domain-containing protein [Duncaniella]MCX4283954.1 M6 family metalloprotease domain-containing protein [Duncaniella dubosii]